MKKFVRYVDILNEIIGRWAGLLILPLIFVVMYEVILRKVFNAPTAWGFEMSVFLYGAHFMLGMGFTYLYDRHVRIDVIALQLSLKLQLILRIITFIFVFLPFVGALTYASTRYALHSWVVWEHSWSAWKPPLYLYKTVMPLSMFALFIQGLATFIRDIYKLRGEEI